MKNQTILGRKSIYNILNHNLIYPILATSPHLLRSSFFFFQSQFQDKSIQWENCCPVERRVQIQKYGLYTPGHQKRILHIYLPSGRLKDLLVVCSWLQLWSFLGISWSLHSWRIPLHSRTPIKIPDCWQLALSQSGNFINISISYSRF